MQMRNNYDKDVFNGDIGFVEAVDEEERRPVRDEIGDGVGHGEKTLGERRRAGG